MSYTSIIEFYQQPKACHIASHKIDLLAEDDKYNPFAICNKYATVEICIDDELYQKIINVIIHHDLEMNHMSGLAKIKALNNAMLTFIITTMQAKNIEFKRSSKYFLQSAFAKLSLCNEHSQASIYFQLLGTSSKKKVKLTNVTFMKCATKDLMK